jgi:CubicO group peptidase (beta-lactamase class C family)
MEVTMRAFFLLLIIFIITLYVSILQTSAHNVQIDKSTIRNRDLEVVDSSRRFLPIERRTKHPLVSERDGRGNQYADKFEISSSNPDSARLVAIIDSIMVANHLPGLTACVICGSEIIWSGEFGMANIEQDIEVSDSTLFMIFSMSKPFTGTALMQLYEDDSLGLDDDINDYLPFEVVNPHHPEDIITPWMLLTHTSSIIDKWDVLDSLIVPGDSPIPLGEFLEGYLTLGGAYFDSSNFSYSAPGANLQYSNVGATLIGGLVEVIADSFPLYTQTNIFELLGMDETSWFLAGLDTNHIAMPYEWVDDHYEPYGHYGFPYYPAGQLRTSMPQLAPFLISFMQYGEFNGQRILDSTTVDLMTTVHVPHPTYPQGLIWYRQRFLDTWAWTHTGSYYGGMGSMAFIREENTGIIALYNANPVNGTRVREELTWQLLQYGIRNCPPTRIDEATDGLKIPRGFSLHQNCPNPFNPSTTISYEIPGNTATRPHVTLAVYDLRGRLVRTIVSSEITPGYHQVTWNGKDENGASLSSGIYLYTLKTGEERFTRKMTILK